MDSLNSSVPAFDSSELKELKQKLVDGCHILDHEGITDGFGHVSVRIPETQAFVTIAGVSPGCATLDRLIMLDFDGNYLGGAKSRPMSGRFTPAFSAPAQML
jgi:ribulose-5-phosphate 4-epimerase/fuculose-1-phosphate aldolase